MAHLQRTNVNEVIFAFPGMGKTPLAQRRPGYVDLDFGHFRTAMGVAKQEENKLLKPFAKLVYAYLREGYTVLTNEPKLIPFVRNGNLVKMYLPEGKSIRYSAQKMGVSKDTIQDWVHDWAIKAKLCDINPTFIDVGLDKYLS